MHPDERLKKKCTSECPLGTYALTNTAVNGSCACYPLQNATDTVIPELMANMKPLGPGTACSGFSTGYETKMESPTHSAAASRCRAQCPRGMLVLTNQMVPGSCICYPAQNLQNRLVPFVMNNMQPLGIGVGEYPCRQ